MKGQPSNIFPVVYRYGFRLAVGLGILVAGCISGSRAQVASGLQLLSVRTPTLGIAAGGAGNSDLPIVSGDGRYVVFASPAGNLTPNVNPGPVSGLAAHVMQVFVRDRVAGSTTLVSVNALGMGGNGDSFPDGISTNGQFVLFESAANNLAGNDNNNANDVFIRDLVNQTTTLVSVNTNGVAAGGGSYNATMTPDGRYVAFVSAAPDMVTGDTNGIPDIFVRDRVANTTVLASVGAVSTGSVTLPATSESPDITPDGRYVAFYSTATNLVPGLTNAGQIFVRDLVGGTTAWASTNAPGIYLAAYQTAGEIACNPRISADGQHVAYEVCTSFLDTMPANGLILRYNLPTGLTDRISSNAVIPAIELANINSLDTLDMTPDGQTIAFIATNSSVPCAEVWSAQSGTVTIASQNLSGGVTTGDTAYWPRLDITGRYVAFLANAANLTANTASGYNCYVRDLQSGVTTLISVDINGVGEGVSSLTPPSVSTNGQVIAFVAGDGGLVTNDNNGATDVFVRDVTANATQLISASNPGQPNSSATGLNSLSSFSVSSNGLFVAFTSEATDLVPNDTNQMPQVYVRDVVNGTNLLVSVNTNGVAGSGLSFQPSISADGRYVAFSSTATDLIGNDTNNARDVFVRDLQAGTTTLVSRDLTGTGEGIGAGQVIGDSYSPTISADGRYVLYYSYAINLTSGNFSGTAPNLFLRDLQLGTNYAITAGEIEYPPMMTPDGHRVGFVGLLNNGVGGNLYVWDTLQTKIVYTNFLSSSINSVSISPDGTRVAYVDTTLRLVNLISNTVTMVSAGSFPTKVGEGFSSDGRFMVYSTTASNVVADTNSQRDIYLYDSLSGTNILISQGYNTGAAPNGPADSPVISPNGRFIAYRTLASNNVPTDVNGTPDLLLYDRSNNMTRLVTPSLNGNWTVNNRSWSPVFSADSKSLTFASEATDLTGQDFNNDSDVFRLALDGSSVATTNSDGSPILVSGLQIIGSPAANQNPALSWPATAGTFYQVQYKNNLTDPVWLNVTGETTVSGGVGQDYDLAPSTTSRFYRVIPSN